MLRLSRFIGFISSALFRKVNCAIVNIKTNADDGETPRSENTTGLWWHADIQKAAWRARSEFQNSSRRERAADGHRRAACLMCCRYRFIGFSTSIAAGASMLDGRIERWNPACMKKCAFVRHHPCHDGTASLPRRFGSKAWLTELQSYRVTESQSCQTSTKPPKWPNLGFGHEQRVEPGDIRPGTFIILPESRMMVLYDRDRM